jgi:hypothetical protein
VVIRTLQLTFEKGAETVRGFGFSFAYDKRDPKRPVVKVVATISSISASKMSELERDMLIGPLL